MAVAGSAAAPALRDVTLILALCKSSALVYKVIDLAAKDWHRSVDACVALLGDRGVTATAEKSLFVRSNMNGGCWLMLDTGTDLVQLIVKIMRAAGQGHKFTLYTEEACGLVRTDASLRGNVRNYEDEIAGRSSTDAVAKMGGGDGSGDAVGAKRPAPTQPRAPLTITVSVSVVDSVAAAAQLALDNRIVTEIGAHGLGLLWILPRPLTKGEGGKAVAIYQMVNELGTPAYLGKYYCAVCNRVNLGSHNDDSRSYSFSPAVTHLKNHDAALKYYMERWERLTEEELKTSAYTHIDAGIRHVLKRTKRAAGVAGAAGATAGAQSSVSASAVADSDASGDAL